jgi:regulator of protease activity HflC (stomatin/prohibitin superfamily)
MSKTVEADKAAKAALITAREEHATTRCQANTARLIQENPMIIRLKELQTIAEMGKGSGNTVILVSNDKLASLLETVGVPKKEEPCKGI